MKRLERNRSGSAGFTLLELMIAGVFLVVLLGAFHAAVTRGAGVYRATVAPAALEDRALRVVNKLAEMFAESGESVMTPAPPDPTAAGGGPLMASKYVIFPQNLGYEDGKNVFGPDMRIQVELEDGELDDGVDNNGNGLVDEGRIVLVQDVGGANEARRMLIGGVAEALEGEIPQNGVDDNGNGLQDESGFAFWKNGTTLTIALTLEGIDQAGKTISRTVETAVKIRN